MRRTLQRIIAFVRGDINTAEELREYSEWGPVPWIADSARDEKLATYAVEVTFRGATHASAAVESVEKKASSLLTIVLALIPVGFAVTALSARRIHAVNVAAISSLALFCVVDLLLIMSAVVAFLASGLVRTGGVNPGRLTQGGEPQMAQLKATEADAWHYATMVAMEAATRKARDLFQARRLVILAMFVGMGATVLFSIWSFG